MLGQKSRRRRKKVVLSIAHCGPIAEIVSRKLLSLFVVGNSQSKSSKAQHVRVASVRSFGDDVASVDAFLEEEEEECEDENETLRLAVVVVETVENDDIAREGMALVKRLCRAAKEKEEQEKQGGDDDDDDEGQHNEKKKKKKKKKKKRKKRKKKKTRSCDSRDAPKKSPSTSSRRRFETTTRTR